MAQEAVSDHRGKDGEWISIKSCIDNDVTGGGLENRVYKNFMISDRASDFVAGIQAATLL